MQKSADVGLNMEGSPDKAGGGIQALTGQQSHNSTLEETWVRVADVNRPAWTATPARGPVVTGNAE